MPERNAVFAATFTQGSTLLLTVLPKRIAVDIAFTQSGSAVLAGQRAAQGSWTFTQGSTSKLRTGVRATLDATFTQDGGLTVRGQRAARLSTTFTQDGGLTVRGQRAARLSTTFTQDGALVFSVARTVTTLPFWQLYGGESTGESTDNTFGKTRRRWSRLVTKDETSEVWEDSRVFTMKGL